MKIRTRLVLSFTLIVAFGFYYLTDWILKELRPRYVESAEETLVDEAYLLANALKPYFQEPEKLQYNLNRIFLTLAEERFEARIFDLVKTQFEQRVYVTNAQGVVIFDSTGLDVGADYSNWNNVFLTLQGRYGARTSHETKFYNDSSVLHVSAPIRLNGRIVGTVTVAKPTTNINVFVESAKPQFVIAGLTAATSVALLAVAISFWIVRPLDRLRGYARDVRDGKAVRLPQLGQSELADLGVAFEEMRKSLEGKNCLEQHIQTLTHELKSPLAAIVGASELMMENLPPEDQHKFARNIHDEARRMRDLIEHLLELAALENQIVLEKNEMVDLAKILETAISAHVAVFSAKTIAVHRDFEAVASVLGDPLLLRQVFDNILQNAAAFCRNGNIKISLKNKKPFVQIIFENDGPSIPDYALPRIFDKFYSLPRPDTGRKSSGLGLVFVQEIVKLHGGHVSVANRNKSGVIVTIDLPIA